MLLVNKNLIIKIKIIYLIFSIFFNNYLIKILVESRFHF